MQSHNSWSYLRPRNLWLKPFAFMAKCQKYDIKTQYKEYGVRCFDLRIRFNDDGKLIIAHGIFEYDYSKKQLYADLKWLNDKGDCFVRVLHEARTKKQYSSISKECFQYQCEFLVNNFPDIKFYYGKNLYDYKVDFVFENAYTEEEKHASVCKPRIIDDIWPWIYSKLNNKSILQNGTNCDMLSIDFVNIR